MKIRRTVLIEEWRCRRCGLGGTDNDIVDHILSLGEGGTDARENLQRLCRRCHAKKTGRESARGKR